MRVRSFFVAAAAVGALAACDDDDSTGPGGIVYNAPLRGVNERPNPVTTNALGSFTATLDPATNVLSYTLTWEGLSSISNNAHIHGPTPATGNGTAGVLIDFNAGGRTLTHGTSGTATGTIDLNLVTANAAVSGDSLKKLLEAGRAYVNVHSTTNPGGEILGLITRRQ
jgi:hypothetical protein